MSAENVIINFVGDTSELKPVENVMENIIQQGEEVGDTWSKTSQKISNANKSNLDSTNKLAKSLENLVTASKSLDKNVVGGAYKNSLNALKTELGLTNKGLIDFLQNARKVAQAEIANPDTTEDVNQLALSIEVINDQLLQLGDFDGTTLAKQINTLKNELLGLKAAGKENTQEFSDLKNEIVRLEKAANDTKKELKNLGSDTKNIDGIISAVSGVAGGFAVAQGAAALFGDENEEVQKALLKVNAAMSILQGLQAIQNVLQKESAASLLLNTSARAAQTTAVIAETAAEVANAEATVAVTIAEGSQVVATEAATVAQTELNVAMSLNPVGLVIAGVLALIGVLAVFSGNNSEAAATQRDLNQALTDATYLLDLNLKSLEKRTAKDIALAKQNGASSIELTRLEGAAANKRLKILDESRVAAAVAYNAAKADDKATLESKEKLYDRIIELKTQYDNEYNALEVKSIEFRKTLADNELKSFIAFQDAKVLATRSGSIAEKNASITAIKATRDAKNKLNPDLTPGELAKNAAEDARAISDIQLQIYAYTLKSITSMDEANVANKKRNLIKNQVDSIASIEAVTKAEIASIRARENEQIKSNPNLSTGERAKIEAEASLQIAELRRQQEIKLLEIKKAGINAELILAQKGTQDEYDVKIKFIENAQQIELAATQLTQEQIAEIKAKYQKQSEDALRFFNEAQLQNQISIDNAALDKFGITEDVKLLIVLKRLDEQRQLEISQADENAAKIAEINAKYQKQTIEAKKATIKAILDDNLRTVDAFTANYKAANEKILSSNKSTYDEKVRASNALLKVEHDRLDLEHIALTKQVEQNLITNHEFDVAYQEILNKRAAATKASEERITAETLKEIDKRTNAIKAAFVIFQTGLQATLGTNGLSVALTEMQNFAVSAKDIFDKVKAGAITSQEGIKQLAVAAIAATQQIINQVFADSAAARQQQLSDTLAQLEEQKGKELDNKNLTEQQKADIEEKYKQRERQEKIKAFQADKEAKKQQAAVNAALAITQAFATNPFPYSLIVAAIVAASTAIQIAKINSTPIPKFKTGKQKGSYEGLGIVDDGGKIEPILRADGTIEMASGKPKDRLTYLAKNDMVFPSMEHLYKHFSFPQIPSFIQANNSTHQQIDYDKLAEAVANKMAGIIPSPAQIHNHFDGGEVKKFIITENSKTEIKNKYFSMS